MDSGPEEVAAAVSRLRAGGVVAFPTETVYGLGADALDARAVGRVFELKGRPADNPLIVHVSGIEMARTVVAEWPEAAERLARVFWPGPLTLVLPASEAVPGVVTGGGPTVGVRCPSHPLTLALLEMLGRPLVGPSANPSGRISPTEAGHVRASFRAEDVLVLDGGPCRGGIESTVLWLAEGPPRVLRPGLIGAEAVAEVLGVEVEAWEAGKGGGGGRLAAKRPKAIGPAEGEQSGKGGRLKTGSTEAAERGPLEAGPAAAGGAGGPAVSPGLRGPHYAPVTPARLFEGGDWPGVLAGMGRDAIVLTWSGLDVPQPHRAIGMPRDAAGYARRLYAALREADASGAGEILIERPPGPGRVGLDGCQGGGESSVWAAVRERLRRACGEGPAIL